MNQPSPKGQIVQHIKRSTGLITLDSDFDGTVSDTIKIDGDYPIVGLLIDLSAAATCTIQIKEAGKTFKLMDSTKIAELVVGDGVITEIGAFLPELGPFQSFTVTASATQTDAVIYGILSS